MSDNKGIEQDMRVHIFVISNEARDLKTIIIRMKLMG